MLLADPFRLKTSHESRESHEILVSGFQYSDCWEPDCQYPDLVQMSHCRKTSGFVTRRNHHQVPEFDPST